MLGFRHGDPRYPFLWEDARQPPARWHGTGEGPVQYLADTPDAAWAEFLRHEDIDDEADLPGISRLVWVVEVPDAIVDQAAEPALDPATLTGGDSSYPACQDEARRLRAGGATALRAPSAALLSGGARGQISAGGTLGDAAPRDGLVWILYGVCPDLVGWAAGDAGTCQPRLLSLVRHLA
jgi:hypothetical protein